MRYEAPKESTTASEGVYVEPDKLHPQSGNGYGLYGLGPGQFVPRTTPNYFYNNNGENGGSARFPEVFRPEIFEKNNNEARYESRRTPFQTVNAAFSGRVTEDGKHRYDAKAEGYYDGYEGGTTYEYDSGRRREGYHYHNNQQNQEKQEEYIP